jgi:hypothetical protein
VKLGVERKTELSAVESSDKAKAKRRAVRKWRFSSQQSTPR